MPNLTGRLGTNISRAGQIWLGKSAIGTTGVNQTLAVSEQITDLLVMGPYQRLVQSISVTEAIGTKFIRAKFLTDAKSVTETIAAVPSPYAYVTQELVEVFYTDTTSYAYVSQQLVEVFYKRGFIQSITDTVHVTDLGHPGTLNSQSVASSITVTPTIAQRSTGVHITVTNTVTVTSTIVGRDNINRQSKTDTGTVSSVISQRSTPIRKSVSDSITVSSTFQREGTFSLHVTDTATVSVTIGERDSVIRKTVTDSISVLTSIGFAGISDFMTVTERITVTPAIAFRLNPVRKAITDSAAVASSIGTHADVTRKTVTDSATVASTIAKRTNPNRQSITSNITVSTSIIQRDNVIHIGVIEHISVTSTPFGRNTHPRIAFSETITVAQISEPHDTNPHVLLRESATVHETIAWRNTIVRISFTETVTTSTPTAERDTKVRLTQSESVRVTDNLNGMSGVHVNPNRKSVNDFGTVTEKLVAQQPKQSLHDSVSVNEKIRTNNQSQSVSDLVHVASTFAGGDSNRSITQSDSVHVVTTIAERSTVNRQSITQLAVVTSTTAGHGKFLSANLTETASVIEFFTLPNFIRLTVTDTATISEVFGKHVIPTRESISETATVHESMRVSPNIQSVIDTVSVGVAFGDSNTRVHERISVYEQINKRKIQLFFDALSLSETLTKAQTVALEVDDAIHTNDTVQIGGHYAKQIDDILKFPDFSYDVETSLGIVGVPVVIGAFVANLVTLTSLSGGQIVLAAPEWNDGEGLVATVTPKRTMTGLTYTFIKTTDRRKLVWTFRMSVKKYIEFRDWVIASISEQINFTDWKGRTWVGYITNNPVNMTDSKNTTAEWEVVELQLEAVLLSG